MLCEKGFVLRYRWFVLSVLSLVLLLGACVVPATMPAATPATTPAATPAPTPTATSTSAATYRGQTYGEWLSTYLAGRVKYYDYLISYGLLVLKLTEAEATTWASARASP
jgi:hypothetical protein